MIKKSEVASIRLITYDSDFNSVYKALIIKKNKEQVVANIMNPDNFINFITDIQNKNGVHILDQIPLKVETKTSIQKNSRVFLRFMHDVAMAALLFYSVNRVRHFMKDSKRNILGKSKFDIKQFQSDKNVKVRFQDVAGMEESKLEVMEFVDFLKNPKRYQRVGAKLPRGALMYGPPGTGKTMLAKACAGEAGVPFFYTSGSEFVEMYGGVGASRVRQLFKEAKEAAPAIVFIDEIDAIGRKRDSGPGSSDEKDTTLNQLLVELDGFGTDQTVVVFAATNRKDILDPALTRSGRLDRAIEVNLPDIEGRMLIFKVHLTKLNLSDQEIEKYSRRLATITPGFSGSEIANICNEAAILAARDKRDKVIANDFEKAVDRVIGGLEMKRLSSKKSIEKVAIHESGHGVVAWFLEGGSPLLKLTIVPRSKGSLGYAQYLPTEETLQTLEELKDQIAVILSGRLSEEIFFGEVTTGAYDDLQKAHKIAKAIVTTFGMSDKIGLIQHGETEYGTKRYSEETNQLIDEEIHSIIKEAEEKARKIIIAKKDLIRRIADVLIEKETIDIDDIQTVLGKRPFEIRGTFKKFLEEKEKLTQDAKLI